MDFKNLVLFVFSLFFLACGGKVSLTDPDENIIGVKVDKISSLVNTEGADSDQIAMFDEMKRRIHQFSLAEMTHLRSLSVEKPDLKHSVVAQERGRFVIDMYDQNIAIYNKAGQVDKNPINLVGEPVSVAFRPELNLFVIYDSLNSVGLLQMDENGNVLKHWVGGSLLGDETITAGDLLASGQLVLSLSNDLIAVVDTDQTLSLPEQQRKWVYTKFTSPLPRISWIAPVRDNPNQIFVKGESEIALIDLVTKTKVDSVDLSREEFEKISKSFDSHVITRSSKVNNEISLYYPQNSKILKRTLQKQGLEVSSSQLNLSKDKWSFVETTEATNYYDNSLNKLKQNRLLKMFRPSDMAALKKMNVPDQAQVLISSSSLFALFPSDIGYAVRYDVLSGAQKEARRFNLMQ